jgi:hypothetical protein
MTEQTSEQLEARKTAIHAAIKALKREKREIDAVLQARTIAESALRKLHAMSSDERAVAAKLIGQAGGIPSEAAVGTPGGQ